MDAFETLRRQAVVRRDSAINEARRKCQEILRWVDKLERKLVPPPPTKPEQKRQALCDLLCGLMPTDREFTTAELFALARQAQPHRRLTMDKVRFSLAYLEETDRVRRTRLIDAKIQWAGPGFVTKTKTWVVPTIAKVAEKVLQASRPMTLVDLLVAVRESGFRADDDPRKVRNALAKALYTNRRFRRDGKLWAVSR